MPIVLERKRHICRWKGVLFTEVLQRVKVRAGAEYALVLAQEGYTLRQPAKCLPYQPQRRFHHPIDPEIPFRRVESRHAPGMQHRPFNRKRLARRQPPFRSRLLLFFPPSPMVANRAIAPILPAH
jgi:hypothetical protein